VQHGEPQQRLHIDVVRLHLEGLPEEDEHVGFTGGDSAPACASPPRGPCSNVRTVSPGMSRIASPVAAVAISSCRPSVPALNRAHSTRSIFFPSCAIKMMRRRRMFQ